MRLRLIVGVLAHATDVCDDDEGVLLLQSHAFLSRGLQGRRPTQDGATKVEDPLLVPLEVPANATWSAANVTSLPRSRADLGKLAVALGEASLLLLAELGVLWRVVEASSDVRLLVVGFPLSMWILHRLSCRRSSKKADLPKVKFPVDYYCEPVETSEAEEDPPTRSPIFDQVGCALELTDEHTVAFRSLAINAPGLAYTALGRPVLGAAAWRLHLGGEGRVTVGCLAEEEVATASKELTGDWAFVRADRGHGRGRGFAYCTEGAAVHRGGSLSCAALGEGRPLELRLDTDKRTLDVFAAEPAELLCSFTGIRSIPYRLAISLREGSVRVEDLRTSASQDLSSE